MALSWACQDFPPAAIAVWPRSLWAHEWFQGGVRMPGAAPDLCSWQWSSPCFRTISAFTPINPSTTKHVCTQVHAHTHFSRSVGNGRRFHLVLCVTSNKRIREGKDISQARQTSALYFPWRMMTKWLKCTPFEKQQIMGMRSLGSGQRLGLNPDSDTS